MTKDTCFIGAFIQKPKKIFCNVIYIIHIKIEKRELEQREF